MTPTLNYMAYQKMSPRLNFYDRKYSYYLYCYLNPFKIYNKVHRFKNIDMHFYYEPFYIGKASTNTGFRHNQHLANFLYEKDKDSRKSSTFNEINQNMNSGKDFSHINPLAPKNWEEYKNGWIVVLYTSNSAEELIQAERDLIKTIGTKKDNTGPLDNEVVFKNHVFNETNK
jgi:hypothetical protein